MFLKTPSIAPRFTRLSLDVYKRQPHAFIPFGAGPRACIGRHFAMAELVLMLASIAQRCELRLAPGQDVRMNARVTLAPQFPIQMEILERRS